MFYPQRGNVKSPGAKVPLELLVITTAIWRN